jgi:hypothetical protein
MPTGQDKLLSDTTDSFAGSDDLSPPAERTVRRQVSSIWKEFVFCALG